MPTEKHLVDLYQTVFNGNESNGFIITNAQGEVVWCNTTVTDVTGFSFTELQGHKPGKLLQGVETDPATVAYISRQVHGGKSFECEILNYTKDKKPYWIHLMGQPIRNKEGKIVNFIAQQTFIEHPGQSGHYHKVQKHHLEHHFDYLLKHVNVGIIITDEQQQVVFTNPKVLTLFNVQVPADQLYGMHYTEVMCLLRGIVKSDVESSDRIKKILEQSSDSGHKIFQLKDGTVILHQNFAIINDGRYDGHVWRFEDITEETKQKQEILDLQHLLLETNAAARIGSWQLNVETGGLYWSDVTREIHEVPHDFVPTLENAITFYPDGPARLAISEAVKTCIEKGVAYELEIDILTARGNKVWVRTLGKSEQKNGKTIKIFGSFQDITKQKQLQIELEKKTQEYRSLFEQNPNGVYSLDNEGRFSEVNDQLLKIAACRREDIIGKHYTNFIGEDKKAWVDKIFYRVRSGETMEYEITATDMSGVMKDLHVTTMPILVQGEVVGSYGIVSDISDKKRMARQLEESEERFRLAMEGARDAIWDVNLKTNKKFKSERLAEMLGYTLDELYDDEFYNSLYHPEDNNKRESILQSHLEGKTPYYAVELRMRTSDGQYRWFASRGKASWDESGTPVRITGSLSDIHEEKLLQQELQLSNQILKLKEEELRKALELQKAFVSALPDKILQLNEDGIIEYLHIPDNSFLFRNGAPQPGTKIVDVLEEGAILLEAVRQCIHNNQLKIKRFSSIRRNETGYFEARIVPADQGKALLIIRNATAEQKSQQQLVINEAKYTSLIENMNIGLLEVDNDEIITKTHPAFCRMTGYDETDLLGKKASAVFSPDNERDKMNLKVQERRAGIAENYETQIIKKTGEVMDVLISGAPLYDSEGKVIGSVGIHHDVTKQKRTSRLLHESNSIGKVGTYEIDLIRNRVTWNHIMWDIYETEKGFQPDISEVISFYAPGESRRRAEETFVSMQSGTPRCEDVFEIITRNGNRKWVKTVAAAEFSGNKVIRIVGIAIDVSQAIRYEQELKNHAQLSETILTSIKDGFFVADKDWNYIFINEAACNFAGLNKEKVIGKKIWDVLPHTKEKYYPVFEEAILNQNVKSLIDTFEADGKLHFLDISIYPTREGGISVLYRDVTAEKEAEHAIKSLNNKYRAISKATNQIIYEWNLVTQEIVFNDVYYYVTGYENTPEVNSGSFNLQMVHPDDIVRVQQSIQHCISNKMVIWAASYRFKVADGTYRHMHSRGIIHYDDAGNPLSLLGTIEDITDRIRLNEKLVREKVNAQRKINEAVIDAQEKEREFIGRELHDNVNQILTTAGLYVQLAESESFSSGKTVEEVKKLIQRAIEEIRMLSRRLTPPSLKDIGLSVAIRDLVGLVSKASHIHFRVNISEEVVDKLSSEKGLVLYRVCQELLNNVLKYSQATNCFIILEKNLKNNIRLMIKDDGKGFDAHKVKKGVGLNSTVARVEVYGGKFEVDTSPGKGCTVTIEIPF